MGWPPGFTLSLAGRRRRPSTGRLSRFERPCLSVFIRGYHLEMRRLIAAVACLAVWSQGIAGQDKSPIIETVADTGFLQLQTPSFDRLTPKQKQLAYWLAQ